MRFVVVRDLRNSEVGVMVRAEEGRVKVEGILNGFLHVKKKPLSPRALSQASENIHNAAKNLIDVTLLQKEDSNSRNSDNHITSNKQSCRLCGGSTGPVKRFDEICVEIGDTYKCILYYITGVKVQFGSDLICLNCINQMKVALNFKVMVGLVFEKTPSEMSSDHFLGFASKDDAICPIGKHSFNTGHAKNINRQTSRGILKVAIQKKALVPCIKCDRKYPVMRSENNQEFTCARCKIKKPSDRTVVCAKCKAKVSSRLLNFHMEMHNNSNLKGRCR
ncbi:uncharacterized protein LOC113232163 [Hyposmocoma kahamanoa]|uniref:uncharacterized protein LOC113232163 n=1 Tax=Hyposmocoma kahamanoa TaxID=1477025 RepID=UPI000E6D96E8|nr:uncharacterized protein LOC113232163 [Hyposmocoma kahamanoa]